MVRVNKKYLEKELQTESWRRFLNAIKKSWPEEELIRNIKKFLTSSEMVMLEKRLAIPILLERGLSYREIGKTIDVSHNTISFVKHNLTRKPVVHRKYSNSSLLSQRHKKDVAMPHGKLFFPQRRQRI